MMARRAHVIGDKELIKRLDALGSESQTRKMARPAISEAATKINKRMKAYSPQDSGLLKKAIGIKRMTHRGVVIAIIGVRHGYKTNVFRSTPWGTALRPADPTKYAHLIEFGTAHTPPQSFMRRSYSKQEAQSTIERRLRSEIRKAAQNRSGNFKAGKANVSALRKAGKA